MKGSISSTVGAYLNYSDSIDFSSLASRLHVQTWTAAIESMRFNAMDVMLCREQKEKCAENNVDNNVNHCNAMVTTFLKLNLPLRIKIC